MTYRRVSEAHTTSCAWYVNRIIPKRLVDDPEIRHAAAKTHKGLVPAREHRCHLRALRVLRLKFFRSDSPGQHIDPAACIRLARPPASLSRHDVYRQSLTVWTNRVRLGALLGCNEHRVKIARNTIGKGWATGTAAAGAVRIRIAAMARIELAVGNARPLFRRRALARVGRFAAAGQSNRQIVGNRTCIGTIAVGVLWRRRTGRVILVAVPRAIRAVPVTRFDRIQWNNTDIIPNTTFLGLRAISLKVCFNQGLMMLLRVRAIERPGSPRSTKARWGIRAGYGRLAGRSLGDLRCRGAGRQATRTPLDGGIRKSHPNAGVAIVDD